jgi:Holliday junction resolvase RusA-like endonuclease
MKVIVPGKPISKMRPQFVKKTGRAYNGQETEEGRFLLQCLNAIKEKKTGALTFKCLFVFARPKSHYGTGRNALILKPKAPQHHIVKPDWDNLSKFTCDCLNGMAYSDDCVIVYTRILKRWAAFGEESRTEFTLEDFNEAEDLLY